MLPAVLPGTSGPTVADVDTLIEVESTGGTTRGDVVEIGKPLSESDSGGKGGVPEEDITSTADIDGGI